VQNIEDPQTLNRYSYARNNPLRYVDPTGKQANAWEGIPSWFFNYDLSLNLVNEVNVNPNRFGLNINTYVWSNVANNPTNLVVPYGLVNWEKVGWGALEALGGGLGVVGAAFTGASTAGGATAVAIPLVCVSIPAFGHGISQVIAGFAETNSTPNIPPVSMTALVTLAATGDLRAAETADLLANLAVSTKSLSSFTLRSTANDIKDSALIREGVFASVDLLNTAGQLSEYNYNWGTMGRTNK
jgi:hypothetical protein